MIVEVPSIAGAPGLAWRHLQSGWEARWRAPADLVDLGYRPETARIWLGPALTPNVRQYIVDQCVRLQADMERWAAEQKPITPIEFDGMLHSLIDAYLHHRLTPFRKNRYGSRRTTIKLCERLRQDRGSAVISELRYLSFLEWSEEWKLSGVPMSHALMGMLRTLFGFGMMIMEDEACARVSAVLHKMKFEMGKPSTAFLTYEHVVAICNEAHRLGFHSIAAAQKWAWGCTFRQKDVIGEYVPLSEPGITDLIVGNMKCLRLIRWEELDDSFTLHHITSKRQKLVEPPVLEEPLLIDELRRVAGIGPHTPLTRDLLPASGPIIVNERTGVPWVAGSFRKQWRDIARSVGVPDEVKNMHTRHGAITESTNAGVSLEIAAKAASHTNTSTTAGYSRDQSLKHGIQMRARAESRKPPTDKVA